MLPTNSSNDTKSVVLPKHTELLLRKTEENKAALKEKFVAIYEAFFMVIYPTTFFILLGKKSLFQ
jgi:hypothetical protein